MEKTYLPSWNVTELSVDWRALETPIPMLVVTLAMAGMARGSRKAISTVSEGGHGAGYGLQASGPLSLRDTNESRCRYTQIARRFAGWTFAWGKVGRRKEDVVAAQGQAAYRTRKSDFSMVTSSSTRLALSAQS